MILKFVTAIKRKIPVTSKTVFHAEQCLSQCCTLATGTSKQILTVDFRTFTLLFWP